MKLKSLLPVLSEYGTTVITDWDTLDELARYDGRNSIPRSYDNWNVMEIIGIDNTVKVYIDDEYMRG